MRSLRSTPAAPIFYGQVHFGLFQEPFEQLNLIDADINGHRWVPRWWRNLRLKEWQHFGIISDDVYCGMAVFDGKFMGTSFFYVVDRATHVVLEHKRTSLNRGAIHVPERLIDGNGFFRAPGYHIQIKNRVRQGTHHLSAQISAEAGKPAIQADFILHEDLNHVQPLIAVLPINDYRRPMYTHKAVCPVEGYLRLGDREWKLSRERSWGLIDVQKTFYPRDAFWTWATFAGTDHNGVPIAVNLTHNMIRNDEEWNECCAWIDGRLSLLSAARFQFDPRAILKPWEIVTTDGRVKLIFTPEGERAEQINLLGIIQSDFHQPFGTYRGTIVDDAGQQHVINGAFGVAEHHILKA